MPYIASCMVASLLLGAGWYLLDKRLGVRIYRFLYDLSHESPLAGDAKQGFIYNRKAQARLTAAIVLCLLQTGLLMAGAHEGPLLALFAFFAEVPVMMMGFYIGPTVDRMWERRDALLDKVDRLESGEASVKTELLGVSRAAVGVVRDAVSGDGEPAAAREAIAVQPAKPAEEAAAKAEEDPRAFMNKYLRRDEDGKR